MVLRGWFVDGVCVCARGLQEKLLDTMREEMQEVNAYKHELRGARAELETLQSQVQERNEQIEALTAKTQEQEEVCEDRRKFAFVFVLIMLHPPTHPYLPCVTACDENIKKNLYLHEVHFGSSVPSLS